VRFAPEPDSPAPDDESRWPGVTLAVIVALIALVVIPYAQVGQHEFVRFDDFDYIVDNPHVNRGLTWDGVKWAFTSFHLANWHPLTWLSHMLDCELFGLEPGGHHLHGVVLHLANALLLFAALRLMTGSTWPSALVAALFAVHPMRVESVAWASERKDLLAGFFWILATLAYVAYVRRPRPLRYLSVLVLFAAGLLSKPTLVTFPFVLLLLDIWPLGRWSRAVAEPSRPPDAAAGTRLGLPAPHLLLEKIPMLALAAAASAITLLAQSRGGAVEALEGLSLLDRASNALVAYVGYLWRTLWPSGLAFYYPHPALVTPDRTWSLYLPAAGAAIALAGLTFIALRSAPRRGYLLVGWLWYVGTMVPVIGLVQVGNQAMADRYVYLPLIGVYIMIAWGLRDLAVRSLAVTRLSVAVASLAVVSLGVVTWVQVGYWRNSHSLFHRALQVTSDNYVAHNNLGNLHARGGELDRAAFHYESALRVMPGLAEAHNNLGAVRARQGKPRLAEEHYRNALRVDPDYAKAHYNLAITLETVGKTEEAETHYRRALRASPRLVEARQSLGDLLGRLGRYDEAIAEYGIALAEAPGRPSLACGLAWLLATCPDSSLRNGADALRLAERCVSATPPENPAALDVLAAALAETGDFAEAARRQREAVDRVAPQFREESLSRLRLYESGLPYRMAAEKANPSSGSLRTEGDQP
jgi:tetratricopeptide (TPR) repeat protein